MADVSRLLESIVAQNLFHQTKRVSATTFIGQSVIALSFFFILLGLGLFIYAAHLWFINHYSMPIAAYFTGLLSLVVALLFGSITFLAMKYRQARMKKIHHEILGKLKIFTDLLDEEFGESIRENPKMSVLIASLMGFLLEDKIL